MRVIGCVVGPGGGVNLTTQSPLNRPAPRGRLGRHRSSSWSEKGSDRSPPSAALLWLVVATSCGAPPDKPAQPPFDVLEKAISELQQAMGVGLVTSHQLVDQCFARIEVFDQEGPALNAMISLSDRALSEAEELD